MGGGAMGRALYDGWIGSGWDHNRIAILDSAPSRSTGAINTHRPGKTMVLLAVKPQHVAPTLEEHAHRWDAGDCIVSIAAGIELASLRSLAPAGIDVFRAMPNLPVRIGKGTICLCHQRDAEPEVIGAIEHALSRLGVCTILDETHIDAFTAMAGSGPAYFYAFVESLAQAGQAAGLSDDVIQILASQVFVGAAGLLEQSEQTPAELRKMVTSPAGTTAAGLEALNRNNALALIIRDCLQAAKTRSRELSSTSKHAG